MVFVRDLARAKRGLRVIGPINITGDHFSYPSQKHSTFQKSILKEPVTLLKNNEKTFIKVLLYIG